MGLIDDAADLLLAGDCPGCGRPGNGLCRCCRTAIEAGRVQPVSRNQLIWPIMTAGRYVDPLARIISQAKDHHRWDVLPLLSQRLALAVAGLVDTQGWGPLGCLVPLPSSPQAVRRRGLDVVEVMAGRARHLLNRAGLTVALRPVLRVRPTRDQGGLGYAERLTNLSGAMSLAGGARLGPGWVVVVDDVVTTGASLVEAGRALRGGGWTVDGAATVGATVLRLAGAIAAG